MLVFISLITGCTLYAPVIASVSGQPLLFAAHLLGPSSVSIEKSVSLYFSSSSSIFILAAYRDGTECDRTNLPLRLRTTTRNLIGLSFADFRSFTCSCRPDRFPERERSRQSGNDRTVRSNRGSGRTAPSPSPGLPS